MKIIKRPATVEDKEFLYSLNKTVYKTLVEKIDGKWDETFQRNYFEQKWNNSGYQIIEKDNIKIGAIWIEYEQDRHTLKEIQLLPDFQRHGIGTGLIESQIILAKKANVPIRLRFLKGNRVQSLYEKLGFRVINETERYLFMKLNV